MWSKLATARVIPMPAARMSNEATGGDELLAIEGITLDVAAHLREAGVTSLSALARLSPHETVVTLDGKCEVAAALDVRPEWVAQARRLTQSREARPRIVVRSPRISRWELPSSVLRAGAAFETRIWLDLGGLTGSTVTYQGRLRARQLPAGEWADLVHTAGMAVLGPDLRIVLPESQLPGGTYRLSAKLLLDLCGEGASPDRLPVSGSKLISVVQPSEP